jgi:hypothetical protein
MFAASKTAKAAAAAAPTDPQFNYVTMLLHGDGTNGAQNNTFLDSSTNNFTITRNGNTTQGTYSPYGANWSNYFDGSSAVVNRSNNTALAMGTGDFTIEFWMNAPSTSSVIVLYDSRLTTSSSTGGMNIYHQSGTLYLYGGATTNVLLVSASITYNQWNHIAFVKSGSGTGNVKMYVNGVLSSTYASADTSNYSLGYLALGAFYNPTAQSFYTGYLSNFRIVKGTAVYTSAFTPPTAPLTAITNTSLLTCADNRFIDDSTNAFALTLVGSPSVQRFSPFAPTSAYSTSVIGGSGFFDGSGDYLSLADNAALQWSTGDFCVEAWIYPSSVSGSKAIVCKGTNNTGTFDLGLYGAKIELYTTALVFSSSASLSANTWTHVAVTRSGTTLRCFINGALDTTVTSSYNFNNAGTFYVGVYGSGSVNYFNGYMSDVRCVKGSAVYTSAFTPPTAPLTSITNTSLLNNFTNAGIFDNAMMNDLETVGNAQISTSVKKYGTGSMSFDGTTDYLKAANTLTSNFGSGAFTVEAWVYFNSVSGTQVIAGNYQSSTVGWSLGKSGSTGYFYASFSGDGNDINGTTTVAINTWYHVAISGTPGATGLKLFVNGVQEGSTYTGSVSLDATTPLYISDLSGLGYGINGYIDDFRITKGYARYTSTFTPPTAAFPNN